MTGWSGPISRRTALRAAGAVIALPMLEAMLPGRCLWTRTAAAASRAVLAVPPARMMFVFLPNGVDIASWPGSATAALADHAGQYSVMRNLCHRNAEALGDGAGDHARSAACFLTGAHPNKTSGGDISVGISVDQAAAAQLTGATRLDSLELGGEPGMTAGDCDSGYSCAYSANISWRGPHTPNGKEDDPRRVFDTLFSMGPEGETATMRERRIQLRTSILDAVGGQVAALSSRVGVADRRKLDEYLEGVRTLERRMQSLARDGQGGTPAHVAPPSSPTDYRERITLLTDMAVLGLQLDQTRIVTLMLANEGSNRSYTDIGVKDGHHDVSHHADDQSKREKYAAINRWQGERLAHLLTKLKTADETGASLLDHTMVVYGGAISDGNRHNHDDLPIILAGGAARGVKHAPVQTAAAGTPLCNLYLAMLQNMNVPVNRFGDSTQAMALNSIQPAPAGMS
jgi:hypothetical protein